MRRGDYGGLTEQRERGHAPLRRAVSLGLCRFELSFHGTLRMGGLWKGCEQIHV